MPELTAPTRQQKITLGEMRSSGVRGLLIYCADYTIADQAVDASYLEIVISGRLKRNYTRACGGSKLGPG